jgi:hypothetical protein
MVTYKTESKVDGKKKEVTKEVSAKKEASEYEKGKGHFAKNPKSSKPKDLKKAISTYSY